MPGPTLAGSAQALDTSLPTIYSEFALLRDVTGVARSCATPLTLNPHEGATKNLLNYGRVTAGSLTDGVDYGQAQTLSDANTGISPSEVGVLVVLSGRTMSRVQDPDLLRRTGRIINNAYNLKEDTDGVNQLASFTATTIGAAGSVGAPGFFSAASGGLGIGFNRTNPEPAPFPWYGIHHDLALVAIANRMIPYATTPQGATAWTTSATTSMPATGSRQMSDEIIREGIGAVTRIGQIVVKADANLIPDANDDVTGACFSQEGLIFVSEAEASMDIDMPKRLRGGAEIMTFGSYAFGNYRAANYGVPVILDASMPTG